MSTKELVALPGLAANMKRSRIEDIEQMKVDARPMELAAIVVALGLPTDWFQPATSAATAAELTEAATLEAALAVAQEQVRDAQEQVERRLQDLAAGDQR